MKRIIEILLFLALICITAGICIALLAGCAKVDVITPEIEYHSFTVLKDISIDPNGVASTTSTATDSVIGGIMGFFTAWAVK
jgi:hypothetical protein